MNNLPPRSHAAYDAIILHLYFDCARPRFAELPHLFFRDQQFPYDQIEPLLTGVRGIWGRWPQFDSDGREAEPMERLPLALWGTKANQAGVDYFLFQDATMSQFGIVVDCTKDEGEYERALPLERPIQRTSGDSCIADAGYPPNLDASDLWNRLNSIVELSGWVLVRHDYLDFGFLVILPQHRTEDIRKLRDWAISTKEYQPGWIETIDDQYRCRGILKDIDLTRLDEYTLKLVLPLVDWK